MKAQTLRARLSPGEQAERATGVSTHSPLGRDDGPAGHAATHSRPGRRRFARRFSAGSRPLASAEPIHRALAVASVFLSLVEPARAEDEVRVALLTDQKEVEVRGTRLALFEGDEGRRLWSFTGRGTARLILDGPQILAQGAGPARKAHYGSAPRILVEAEPGVELGGRLYLGRLEVRLEDTSKLVVINRLPLETYLRGIVGSEMPASWHLEALKAQAVSARTYALQRLMTARSLNRAYDLDSTVISQVYRGEDNVRPSVVEAVRATRGEVLAYDHALVEALFHSTCGGRTVASESYFGGRRAYLRARSCSWCQGSSKYRWRVEFELKELEKRLQRARLSTGRLRAVERENGRPKVRVRDGSGTRRIDAKAFRRAVGHRGLFSDRFSARTKGDKVAFSGRGFGHGVGMCQWGARGMAEEGRTHREILKYYYPGAETLRIY